MGESINQPRTRDQQCYGTQTNNRDYPWSKRARTVFSCYLKLIIWASTFVYLQRTKKYYWKRKTLVVGTIQRKFRRRNMTSKAVQHQRSRITQCSLRKVNPVTYSRNWKKKISTLSSYLPFKASATWWVFALYTKPVTCHTLHTKTCWWNIPWRLQLVSLNEPQINRLSIKTSYVFDF